MFFVRRFQHMIDRLAASALPTIYISDGMSHVAFFVSLFTFRPYCSSYVDAAYCYRRSRVVCLSRSSALQKRLNWSRCRLGCALGCARKHVLWGSAHWLHLVYTIEPSLCGGGVALCQITLTTCSISLRSHSLRDWTSWFPYMLTSQKRIDQESQKPNEKFPVLTCNRSTSFVFRRSQIKVTMSRYRCPIKYYTVSQKRPTFGLLWLWHMWTDFWYFWPKFYR